jgi:hypothetical protein
LARRHASRAELDGKKVDIVICFECGMVYLYSGDKFRILTIDASPRAVLDKILTDANVSLPKQPKQSDDP